MIDIDLTTIEEFEDAWEEAARDIPGGMERAVREAARRIARRADDLTPRHSAPHMADRYKVTVTSRGGKVIATISNPAPYATGAHLGEQGKWSGFQKYGSPGDRFLHQAANEEKAHGNFEDDLTFYTISNLD